MGFAREVEEVALLSTSQPGSSSAVADVPQRPETRDAEEEDEVDTASVIFTEFGDSRASSQTNDLAEEQTDLHAVAEVRMERQTSPVYHTELSADRLQYWRESASIRGEFTGNIGFLFGSWGRMPSHRLVRERV